MDIFLRKNYAHRGLHTKDRLVPENSLAAFRRAAQRGYGIELDVQLSRDGQVVVTSGLKAGDELIVSGNRVLYDGVSITNTQELAGTSSGTKPRG